VSTQTLTHALDEQVRRFSRALGRARRGDATGVHQGRVASRRIREVLPLVASIDETRARRIRRGVRRVAAALGVVRELDVTRDLLADRAHTHAWHPVVVMRVRQTLEAERQARHADFVDALRRVGSTALLRELRRVVADTPSVGVATYHQALGTRRRKRSAALAAALRALGTLYVPDRLHVVRLCAKKLRYSLETERAVRRVAVARDIKTLTGMQEELGGLHDLQMLQDWLRRLGRDVGGDRATHGQLRRMGADLERECRAMHAHVVANVPTWRALAQRTEQR